MTARKTPAAPKPKYLVVDEKLVCQTSNGELKIPLTVKTKLMRQIRNLELADEFDQFVAMLEGISAADTLAALDELDFKETIEIITTFFEEFAKQNRSTVGESSGSSNS